MSLIRQAGENDLSRLVVMAERFHALYVKFPAFVPEDFVNTCRWLIEEHFLGIADNGMLGGLTYPCPFNESSLIAVEMFWWSEDPKEGAALYRRFEKWAKAQGADQLVMVCLNGNPVPYERLGFEQAEVNFRKKL